jgi:tetratricopeptide (TPR) repeat protein
MFKKAIQLAPLYYYGYSNLGAMYLQLGQYQDAAGALKRSIALRPTIEAYGNLGAVYFYMRRYLDSAESLENALKIDSKDWLNWGNLGDTLFQIPSRRAEATNAYQRAIELARARLEVNPHDASTLAFTADYFAMLDQEELARQQLTLALKAAPADADVLFRAAILYNHFGDKEKTLEFLRRSVAAGYSLTVIRDTPDFDHLNSDHGFRTLSAEKK